MVPSQLNSRLGFINPGLTFIPLVTLQKVNIDPAIHRAWKIGGFQGQTVHLPEGILYIIPIISYSCGHLLVITGISGLNWNHNFTYK